MKTSIGTETQTISLHFWNRLPSPSIIKFVIATSGLIIETGPLALAKYLFFRIRQLMWMRLNYEQYVFLSFLFKNLYYSLFIRSCLGRNEDRSDVTMILVSMSSICAITSLSHRSIFNRNDFCTIEVASLPDSSEAYFTSFFLFFYL